MSTQVLLLIGLAALFAAGLVVALAGVVLFRRERTAPPGEVAGARPRPEPGPPAAR